jgi:hypothetical protein
MSRRLGGKELTMKKLMMLLIAVMMVGCVPMGPADYPHSRGDVLFCQSENACIELTTDYYYTSDGELFYYDPYFMAWVGQSGSWVNGLWYAGPVPGLYAHYYGLGLWHPFVWGWHGHYGSNWHEFHGYHPGFHGGWGGHAGRGGHR